MYFIVAAILFVLSLSVFAAYAVMRAEREMYVNSEVTTGDPSTAGLALSATKYDAELHGWQISKSIWTKQDIAAGLIRGDKKNRFVDDTYVYTSAVQKVEQHHDGLFAYTKNSVYKLVGEWKYDNQYV